MHCPVYHITIRSSLCLLYQDRAAGKIGRIKYAFTNYRGMLKIWKSKYKPCLYCETGRQIRENGGKDMDRDVQALKEQKTATKFCQRCSSNKPISEYNRNASMKDGLQTYCKPCMAIMSRESWQKRKDLNRQHDAEPAKIVFAGQDVTKILSSAVEKQAVPQPIGNDRGEIVAWSDNLYQCRKCGLNYGAQEWIGLEYVDDETRVCLRQGCNGVVKFLLIPEELPEEEKEKSLQEISSPALRTCKRCGHEGPDGDLYKVGWIGFTNVCKKCVSKRKLDNANIGITAKDGFVKLRPNAVIIDFDLIPEMLDALKSSAKENFRNLENEILYRLAKSGVSQ
jgi:hypothetical protein